MLSLLRNRSFFWLWVGQAVSLIGDGIRDWALIYWIFKASNQSPVVQSLSFIAVMAPTLVVGPFAGVLVDRWDRKKVMIASDLLRGAISLLMVAAVATGQYWYAIGVVFLGSCVAQFFNPARGAMIPRIVGRDQLVQANSLSQTTNTLMHLAGPALGTGVYHLLGPTGAFTLDAATFFLSALCIAMVAASGAVSAAAGQQPAFWVELKSGFHYIWKSKPVRVLSISLCVVYLGAGAINSLMIFILRQSLGLSESLMVYPSTASPLATLVAAVAVGAAAGKLRRAPLLVSVGLALGAAGIFMIAAAPNLHWLVAGSVLVGLCNAVLNIGFSTTLQSFVPDDLRGRVFGTLQSLPTVAMIASAGVAGYLAQTISPRPIIGSAAGFVLIAALVAFVGLKDVILPEPAAKQAAAATAD